MEKDVFKRSQEKMDESINHYRRELNAVRTGRASLSLLDGIMVDYFGTPTPLNQVASLSTPESRTILIQPWDKTLIKEIDRAVQKSNLGLQPMDDGKVIRINIPALTEDRRRELVKVAKKEAEDARVAIRNVRREGNEELKALEKEKKITEDALRRSQDELQKITDRHIKGIDEILQAKEKEIMEV
jgi:ribosome recycling factor